MDCKNLFGALLCWAMLFGCGDEGVCGDGVIEGSETCEDGNTTSGDGCNARCVVEAGWECGDAGCEGVCGDSVLVADEVCDPTAPGMSEYCSTDCQTRIASCGDGTLQSTAEVCDDGNAVSSDGCDNDCSLSFAHTCTGEPSVCDASDVPSDVRGVELSGAQKSAMCQWFIGALGGAGRQVTCGAVIYTINSITGCAAEIDGVMGLCTVAEFEEWVGARGSACDALTSNAPLSCRL